MASPIYYLDGSVWKDFADENYNAYYSGSPDITGGILFVKGITAIPEPSTILLLLAAGPLALLVGARRRKKTTAQP